MSCRSWLATQVVDGAMIAICEVEECVVRVCEADYNGLAMYSAALSSLQLVFPVSISTSVLCPSAAVAFSLLLRRWTLDYGFGGRGSASSRYCSAADITIRCSFQVICIGGDAVWRKQIGGRGVSCRASKNNKGRRQDLTRDNDSEK